MAGTGTTAAELRGVTKRYGSVVALDGIDLEVRSGEVLAVLGPNGAGKTTAIGLLLGLLQPSAGTARLFGAEPRSIEARQRVGAMLQISHVPDTMKVGELVHLFSSYYPRPMEHDDVLRAAGLDGLGGRLYGKLSGGQKQRVMFALAICGGPDLVFLDEPTVGMDVEVRRAFWTYIRSLAEKGRTIVLTTHYLEEADALADRIVVIDKGRVIASGTPMEIKSKTSGKRVRCRTKLTVSVLIGLPGVTSVRETGAAVELLTGEVEATVAALLAKDPSTTGLEITGAGLEEAFLALTDKADKIDKEKAA